MADEEEDVAADGEEGEGAPPSRKRKLILFGAIGLVVLLGGGGAAAYFLGLFGGREETAQVTAKPSYYYDMPEMIVNLNSTDKRQRYLKVRISLEMSDPKTLEVIRPSLPRLTDAFQVYLRELRSTDLDGSAGMHRLKEELTRRVNIAIYPSTIDTVLFREIIVQ